MPSWPLSPLVKLDHRCPLFYAFAFPFCSSSFCLSTHHLLLCVPVLLLLVLPHKSSLLCTSPRSSHLRAVVHRCTARLARFLAIFSAQCHSRHTAVPSFTAARHRTSPSCYHSLFDTNPTSSSVILFVLQEP